MRILIVLYLFLKKIKLFCFQGLTCKISHDTIDYKVKGDEMENNFVVGKTYETRSACDHNCIFKATVIKKTVKTVTVNTMDGVKRCKVQEWNGEQFFYPLGQYSMAPIMRA